MTRCCSRSATTASSRCWPPPGDLAGVPLIDPTNAVEHGVGELLTPPGASIAGRIAALTGAHVVKAFHLYPAAQWTERPEPVVVPICGDDAAALGTVATARARRRRRAGRASAASRGRASSRRRRAS